MIETRPVTTLDLAATSELDAFAFCRACDWQVEVGHDEVWIAAHKWADVSHLWNELERLGQAPNLRGTPRDVAAASTWNDVTRDVLASVVATPIASATPTPIFLHDVAAEAMRSASDAANSTSSSTLAVRIAYSAKTNPDPRLLALAHEHGLLIEAISQHEAAAATLAGYEDSAIALNGPAKWWPQCVTTGAVHAIFCDSPEELEALTRESAWPASYVGVRLRPPGTASRFGVEVERSEVRDHLVHLLRTLPSAWDIGIHFHIQSSVVGTQRWWETFESMLDIVRRLQHESGRAIRCLDIGGGWDPNDWHKQFLTRLPEAVRAVQLALPEVRELIVEPGKALVQTSSAVCMRVLEVRRGTAGEISDLVVDGSVAEVPQFYNYPHPIAVSHNEGSSWARLGRGTARILGRLCMEKDIIAAHLDVPRQTQAGDLVLVLETGAYDSSTAYSFGLGRVETGARHAD